MQQCSRGKSRRKRRASDFPPHPARARARCRSSAHFRHSSHNPRTMAAMLSSRTGARHGACPPGGRPALGALAPFGLRSLLARMSQGGADRGPGTTPAHPVAAPRLARRPGRLHSGGPPHPAAQDRRPRRRARAGRRVRLQVAEQGPHRRVCRHPRVRRARPPARRLQRQPRRKRACHSHTYTRNARRADAARPSLARAQLVCPLQHWRARARRLVSVRQVLGEHRRQPGALPHRARPRRPLLVRGMLGSRGSGMLGMPVGGRAGWWQGCSCFATCAARWNAKLHLPG